MIGDDASGCGVLVRRDRSLASLSKRERHRGFYSDAAVNPQRPFKAPPWADTARARVRQVPVRGPFRSAAPP